MLVATYSREWVALDSSLTGALSVTVCALQQESGAAARAHGRDAGMSKSSLTANNI